MHLIERGKLEIIKAECCPICGMMADCRHYFFFATSKEAKKERRRIIRSRRSFAKRAYKKTGLSVWLDVLKKTMGK